MSSKRQIQTAATTSAAGQCKRGDDAEQGRDALAALEPQPDRIEMAEQRADRGELATRAGPTARRRAAPPRRPWRSRAAGSPRPGPCGRCAARWSRRYCPSRSSRRSPRAGQPGQQQAERDRAQQIAEQQAQRSGCDDRFEVVTRTPCATSSKSQSGRNNFDRNRLTTRLARRALAAKARPMTGSRPS